MHADGEEMSGNRGIFEGDFEETEGNVCSRNQLPSHTLPTHSSSWIQVMKNYRVPNICTINSVAQIVATDTKSHFISKDLCIW